MTTGSRNTDKATGRVQDLVTVITVVRNDKVLLERSIQSVLSQTYRNIEYIVIDGASTDGTVDVIKKYEDRISCWISEPDRGIYDAMNKGIERATGSWINFMNAGDMFSTTDTVSQVMEHACTSTADLVYGHCQLIYDTDSSVVWKAVSPEQLWRGMAFRHQSLFTRTEICRKFSFDTSYRIGADFAFIFRCYREGYRFCPVDRLITSVSTGGISDALLFRGIWENRRTVIEYQNTLKVNAYYVTEMILAAVRVALKKILPADMIKSIRSFKYRWRRFLFGK